MTPLIRFVHNLHTKAANNRVAWGPSDSCSPPPQPQSLEFAVRLALGARRFDLSAAYDASVDAYRQTVLTAFQQVEDNLAALHVLANETDKVQDTIHAAQDVLTISDAQYRAGTADYLTVISAQATLLNTQSTSVQILTRRLTASVALIQALGGGWNASELPSRPQVSTR